MTTPVTLMQEELIAQGIANCLVKIRVKVAELLDRVDEFLACWLIPEPVKDGVRAATAWCTELVGKAFDAVAEILTHLGSPATLYAAAQAWRDQVGGPLSSLSSDADPAQSPALQDWTGTAAAAYSDALGPQRRAIDALKAAYADAISSQLSTVARSIWAFWGTLIVAFAALAATVVAAVASSATIAGLPAAPFIAGAGALAFDATLLAAGENLRMQCSDSTGALARGLHDDTAFRDGAWPAIAARALSDGSMSDGSDSGWHLR